MFTQHPIVGTIGRLFKTQRPARPYGEGSGAAFHSGAMREFFLTNGVILRLDQVTGFYTLADWGAGAEPNLKMGVTRSTSAGIPSALSTR